MSRSALILSLPAERPLLSQFAFFGLGGLTTAAFAPFGWYLLAPLLLLPILYVCLNIASRDAAKLAFWFGFGLFLTGTYWIYISVAIFGQAPVWMALALMVGVAALMAMYLWLTVWLISRLISGEPWRLLIVAPAAWVLVEWLRGWVFSGFPWLTLGYSQIDSPLAGWAPVVGVYGVSGMLVLSATALLVALLMQGWQRWLAVLIMALPWLSGSILNTVEWTEAAGKPITSTVIQGGISQDRKWLPEQFRPTLEFYREATRQAAASDIVIWPEVAIPSKMHRVEKYLAALEADSRENQQTILFGILEDVRDRSGHTKTYNSFVALDGERRQIYRKRHLVPFGEYFPVPAAVREWLRMMSLPNSDLSAGSDEQSLIMTREGIKLAVAICFEDAFGAEQLYALPDAGLLINISNDAWFGDSIAPDQHLQIARMRALEVGRYSIRATNTGISAFIGPKGELLGVGAQFAPVTMTMDVEPRKGATPYSLTGNRLVIGLCLLIIAGFWLRVRSRA